MVSNIINLYTGIKYPLLRVKFEQAIILATYKYI